MPRDESEDPTSPADPDTGHQNVVGQDGMPSPAPKPKGPKLKFTSEDDALLVELKETKSLTWKQIADFFPGRSSGTLQVRYCTKLKAKTTAWSDELVSLFGFELRRAPKRDDGTMLANSEFTKQVRKLRTAIEDYDGDRWRVISGRVGNGLSAAACREKALELALEIDDVEPEDEATPMTQPEQE